MSDQCRLCSSPLRGSRRKWLFGGSGALLALFSQVLGTPVLRNSPASSSKPGKGKGKPEDSEFLCGKCCHSLNVYHRYDLVLSRMRELYEQRATRLAKEKEKLSFTLRTLHARTWGLPLPEYHGGHQDRNSYGYQGSYSDLSSPGYHKSRNNSLSPGYLSSCPTSPFPDRPGSSRGSLGSLSSGTSSKSYQQLMDRDRSMWTHESWWEDHPRGCSRCIKGEKCHSCSSWRVPDANYESVCTVPRRKKLRRESDDGTVLIRSKSLGSFGGESSNSSKGSLLSLSASSLDSLSLTGEEGNGGVFWEEKSPSASSPPSSISLTNPVVGEVLKSLKEIKYSPVRTPTRSRIPVRGQPTSRAESLDQYLEEDDYERPRVEEPVGDLDAYMEIGPQVCRTQASRSRHIRETLNRLKSAQSGGTLSGQQDQEIEQQEFIRELLKKLRFKEEVLEDSLTLLLTLPTPYDPSGEFITDFVEKLRTREEQIKREGDELAEIKRQRETEVKRLQEELRSREDDITRLSKVLNDNQDTITALRDILGEKDFTVQRLEVALDSAIRTSASQDALRLSALREKDALIAAVQGAMSSSNQDVEALADSLLSQGLNDFSNSIPGLSAPNPLVSQLQEKGRMLSQAHKDNQRQSVQHQRDIQDLLNALNESQTLLQEQLRHCKKRLQDGAQEQKILREALRVKEGELQEERQKHNANQYQVNAKLLQLQDSARERDQATKKLLQDAESRDQMIKKLQEKLSLGGGMRDTL